MAATLEIKKGGIFQLHPRQLAKLLKVAEEGASWGEIDQTPQGFDFTRLSSAVIRCYSFLMILSCSSSKLAIFLISVWLNIVTSFAQTSSGDADRIDLLPSQLAHDYQFEIPPKPPGHVLDLARFLPQDIITKLEELLLRESQSRQVDVYLLVVPSVAKNTLQPFAKKVTDEWMKDLFGAVVVFDDSTGVVCIEQSATLTKRFYEFELANLLRSNMETSKRPRLSRAGLEHTVVTVKDAVGKLKDRADKGDRNSLTMKATLAVIGGIALLIGLFEFSRRRGAIQVNQTATDLPSDKTVP